jgi:CDP-glycerol glycerophosphotransferase (TagB/SpsB family)
MGKRDENIGKGAGFLVNTINLDAKRNRISFGGSLINASGNKPVLLPYFNDVLAKVEVSNLSSTTEQEYIFHIPADEEGKLCIQVTDGKSQRKRTLEMHYAQLARMGGDSPFDYRVMHDRLLLPEKASLTITSFLVRKIVMREIGLFFHSLHNTEGTAHNTPKALLVQLVRLLALVRMKLNRRSVWLFSDRTIAGGDNSEVLFRYVSNQKNDDIKPFFAINANTEAYKRLKKEGYKVVKFRSVRHLYLTVVADLLLPSHLETTYMYPWSGVWRMYCGLMQYDIVHTQHGIVSNDMASYIGKSKKNVRLFLSICNWEKEQLTSKKYGYGEEEVPVTGAPRYDELSRDEPRRVISVHPTWRSWIAPTDKAGRRGYVASFKDSAYYRFYQDIINDKRVIAALHEHDYTLKFYLHPNHHENTVDFTTSDSRVELMTFPYNYMKMLNESAIFVTDYSNTLFDFAYMGKPVMHTQFDKDTFFSKQVALGGQVFDYDHQGFGPVSMDYESAVQTIIEMLEKGPIPGGMYKKRVDTFFTYRDANNSKRAYEAILKFKNAID